MSSRKQADMYRCRIIEADFETGIVTLQMEGKYTVSAGPKLLCDSEAIEQAVLQSPEIQALRKDSERIQFVADEYCVFDTWIQEDGTTKYRLEWNPGSSVSEWQDRWFDSPRDAINAAMEKQP